MISYSLDNLRCTSELPLYFRYPSQIYPQSAFVQMDEDGDISATYSTEIGNAVSSEIWHKKTLCWYVDSEITGDVLADFLESDEIGELLQRVHDGHSVEWVNGNQVGILDEDALEAFEEIESLLLELANDDSGETTKDVWPVDEFLFCSNGLFQSWSNGLLSKAVAEAKADAKNQNIYLDGDIKESLLESALSYVVDNQAGLTFEHLEALVESGKIDQEQADNYADEFFVY